MAEEYFEKEKWRKGLGIKEGKKERMVDCTEIVDELLKNDTEANRLNREILLLKHECKGHDDKEACERRWEIENKLDNFNRKERLPTIRKFKEECVMKWD